MLTLTKIHAYLEAHASIEGGTNGVVSYYYEGRHLMVFVRATPVDEETYVEYIVRKMARMHGCNRIKMRQKVEEF